MAAPYEPIPTSTPRMNETFIDVATERLRQEAKCERERRRGNLWRTCADLEMPDLEKLAVLGEEFGEVCKELIDAVAEHRPPSPNLRVELIQVAAVAVAWAESL